jgi:hypothetical protein
MLLPRLQAGDLATRALPTAIPQRLGVSSAPEQASALHSQQAE